MRGNKPFPAPSSTILFFIHPLPNKQFHLPFRDQVKEMSKPISLMPPMAYVLKKREIRDLIEFLASLDED